MTSPDVKEVVKALRCVATGDNDQHLDTALPLIAAPALLSQAADLLEAQAERIKRAEGALNAIHRLRPVSIGVTGFSTGPASLLRRAQEIARVATKHLRARSAKEKGG